MPTLTLYTKDSCPLCDELVEQLHRQNFMHRLKLEKVYITEPENKDFYERYRYDIPVLHLNGQFLCKHRLDANLLESKLSDENIKIN